MVKKRLPSMELCCGDMAISGVVANGLGRGCVAETQYQASNSQAFSPGFGRIK